MPLLVDFFQPDALASQPVSRAQTIQDTQVYYDQVMSRRAQYECAFIKYVSEYTPLYCFANCLKVLLAHIFSGPPPAHDGDVCPWWGVWNGAYHRGWYDQRQFFLRQRPRYSSAKSQRGRGVRSSQRLAALLQRAFIRCVPEYIPLCHCFADWAKVGLAPFNIWPSNSISPSHFMATAGTEPFTSPSLTLPKNIDEYPWPSQILPVPLVSAARSLAITSKHEDSVLTLFVGPLIRVPGFHGSQRGQLS